MSGRLGDLSPRQEQDLSQFRKSLHDVMKPKYDDRLLLQFLRARSFDLKRAEEMFRRHLLWRETFDEDYFLNEYEPPEFLLKYMLPTFLGFDKGGSPVRLINAGPTDIRGITLCVKRIEIKRFVTWFLDCDKRELNLRNKKTGVYVETRTFIFDLKDISLRQITSKEVVELVVGFLKLYECNYPENLKIAFVINTPPFFAWLFNLIKTLLSEDTVKKVRIYGSSGWKEDLLDIIDAEVLPVSYGGTRTDPDGDPNCRSIIPVNGAVPTTLYLKNQHRLAPEDDGVQKVVISRRSKFNIVLGVDVAGFLLNWEVDCKNCDIHLGLVYGKEGEEEELDVIMAPSRISSDSGLEKGKYVAEHSGKYCLVLDNSYSLLRSKLVLYRTSVTKPLISCSTPD